MSAPAGLSEGVSASPAAAAEEPALDPSLSNAGGALQTSPAVATTTADISGASPQAANNIRDTQGTLPINNYGYGTGMGYGGLGGMYGGLGGMYGGMGMGGMGMGGMGMGGMGMGGMPGMYGMPMTEDFQRNQMTFMLVGRLLEMCGMFAGVVQMTFGSALQFMGNYIGMSQKYNQLNSGMYQDEHGNWVRAPKKRRKRLAAHSSRYVSFHRKKQHESKWTSILRRVIFLIIAVFLVKKITAWSEARKLARINSQSLAYH